MDRPLRFAVSFADRLRGLLGRAPDEELLLIAPCKAIHTFGMRYALDVAFIGRDGTIAAVYRSMKPASRARCAHAIAVIERFARSTPFFTVGDRVTLETIDNPLEKGMNRENLSRL